MNHPFRFMTVACVILLSTALPALGQYPTINRGFEADRAYQIGDIDSVNTFNGNLIASLPIGQAYTGSGRLQYRIGLVYNSKSWDFERRSYTGPDQSYPQGDYTKAVPTKRSNAGMGWLVSLGRLIPPEDPINSGSMEDLISWVYEGPDGADHRLWSTLHPGEGSNASFMYTRDGSYLRLKTTSSTSREVHFPDGTIHTFVKGGNSYWLTQMADPWNNGVQITYHDAAGLQLGTSSYAVAASWKLTEREGGSATIIRTHHIRFALRSPLNVPSNYNRQVSEVELASFGGTTAKYLFNYTDTQIAYSCSGDYRGTHSTGTPLPTVPLLGSVTIPDGPGGAAGSSWIFTHRTTNSDTFTTGCASGMLDSMKLPTLGKIEYTYRIYNLPTVACITPLFDVGQPAERVLSYTQGVSTRKQLDAANNPMGTWTYTPSHALSPYTTWCGDHYEAVPHEAMTTVVAPAPNGTQTKHYFSVWPRDLWGQGHYRPRDFGLPYSRSSSATGSGCDATTSALCISKEVFQTGVGGAKEVTFVRYEGDYDSGVYLPHDLPQRRLAEARTSWNDGSWVNTKHSDFDGLGHYRRADVTSSSGFGPVGTHTTHTRYNLAAGAYDVNPTTWARTTTFTTPATTDPWILHDFDESWIGNGTKVEKTEACFDATGYLTRKRTIKHTASAASSIVRGANDLLTVLTRNSVGNTIQQDHYGGDLHSIATTAAVCSIAIPAHNATTYRLQHTYSFGSLASSAYVNVPGTGYMGFYSTYREIDQHTGLPFREWEGRSTSSGGGISTDLVADRLGRMQWSKPSSGNDAWTELVYTRATGSSALAKVNLYSRPNGSTTTILAQEEHQFDAFGRPWRERRLMEDGSWATRETLYTKDLVSSVSEWDTTLSPIPRTEFVYDWAGRPITATAADGSVVTTSYTGNRFVYRTTKVATAIGIETSATTTEEYDALGRLYIVIEPNGTKTRYTYDNASRLTQVCGGFTTGCVQTRTFNYDGRGFVTSEVHPERSTLYTGYDALGNPSGLRHGPASDVTTVRDRAGRPTLVRETATLRLLKQFTYGTSNVTGDFANGKLKTATRHNWHGRFDINAHVIETYTYGGRGGRVSARSTAIDEYSITSGDWVAHKQWSQGWTWNDLGQPLTLTYPSCQAGTACASYPPPALTVTQDYTNGWLTSSRNQSSYYFGNLIGYHPNGMFRTVTHGNGVVTAFQADPNKMTRPSSITATFGTTTYWSTGAYGYDGSGNIKSIGSDTNIYDPLSRILEGTVEAGLKKQSYTYDPYSNITRIITRINGVVNTDHTMNVSTATNRIQSTGGNIVAGYDVIGNLVNLNGGSYTYTYDALNMMTSLVGSGKDWAYVYTANDERIWDLNVNLSSGDYSIRDLDQKVLRVIHEDSFAIPIWSWKEDYVYRGSTLLSGSRPTGIFQFHVDHLGTPRWISNSARGQVGLHVYYPFGRESTSPSQDTIRLKFTGHERDTDFSGNLDYLDYMHARYYSPIMGRFLSVDSGGMSANRPQSWNRYVYSLNNPVSIVDPDGLEGVWYADQLQSAAAATIGAGSSVRDFGASLNGGGIVGIALDAALGTVGSIVQGYGDVLNLGTSIGGLIGDGGDAYDWGMATSAEIGRASTVIGTVASFAQVAGAPSTVIAKTTVQTGKGAATIEPGMVRSIAIDGRGVVYRPAGSTGNANMIRVASPNAKNPSGYVKTHNASGQATIAPGAKQTGSQTAVHLPLTGRATIFPVKAAVPPASCKSRACTE